MVYSTMPPPQEPRMCPCAEVESSLVQVFDWMANVDDVVVVVVDVVEHVDVDDVVVVVVVVVDVCVALVDVDAGG